MEKVEQDFLSKKSRVGYLTNPAITTILFYYYPLYCSYPICYALAADHEIYAFVPTADIYGRYP